MRAQEVKRAHVLVGVLAACLLAACDDGRTSGRADAECSAEHGDAGAQCISAFDPPTFAAIYDNVLQRRCGSPGTAGSCHGPDGMQAGLLLWEEAPAHASLLGEDGGRARVIPGSPECSELMRRLESSDPNVRMPLGEAPLGPGELCAIRTWIENGAEGP